MFISIYVVFSISPNVLEFIIFLLILSGEVSTNFNQALKQITTETGFDVLDFYCTCIYGIQEKKNHFLILFTRKLLQLN